MPNILRCCRGLFYNELIWESFVWFPWFIWNKKKNNSKNLIIQTNENNCISIYFQ